MSSNNTMESISVSSIMVTDVKTAEETQSVQKVCRTMNESKIGSIVLLKDSNFDNTEDKRPIGIITERDIVRAVGHARQFSIHTLVREIMSSPLITINPNSSIRDTMETMQQKDIRRLAVVDNKGKMLGIVTEKDIFRTILKSQSLVSSFVSDQVLVLVHTFPADR